MSDQTTIEWCDATVNHWAGCTAVSPACDHCYAQRMAGRLWGVQWGPGEARRHFTGAAEALKALDRKGQRQGQRLRVFHNSLSDMFDNEVPDGWRMNAFAAMAATPNLIHIVLTKRIGNVRRYLQTDGLALDLIGDGRVWLGITVCSQTEADRDIPKLLAVPARVRFLSIEPMLGPISLRWLPAWPDNAPTTAQSPTGRTNHLDGLRRLDWIICGGESGPHARPMHPDWVRSLRDQCQAAGVAFTLKQWGEWLPISEQTDQVTRALYRSNRIAKPSEDQDNLDDCYGRTCKVEQRVIQADGTALAPLEPMSFRQGAGSMLTFRVGKKTAGRLLDGVVHDAWPEAQA